MKSQASYLTYIIFLVLCNVVDVVRRAVFSGVCHIAGRFSVVSVGRFDGVSVVYTTHSNGFSFVLLLLLSHAPDAPMF